MGTYGTATGTVIGINPTTGQPVFLHLVAGEAALTLSGGDMSLTGTLEISANGEITWAAGSGIADASQFLLEDLEADNHFRWRIGGSIGTSATDDLSFDGVDDIRYSETLLTWKAANTELDANGNLIATNATLSGTITASAGDVGGWTINSTYLAKDTGTDATSAGLAPTDYPFYAGATYANRASAPFRVTPAGALVASSATITGALTTGAGSSVDGQYLVVQSVTAAKIAANTITAAEIAAGAIATDELAANAVTAAKISVSTLSAIAADMGSLTAGSIVIGTTDKLWLNDTADGALNIGGSVKGSAPFRVTAAGALTATNATISGTITASAGSVGGWTINSTYLAKDTGTDATSAGLAPTDYPFYAGATYANRASAPFRVTPAGALVASSATITGTITASAGSITGELNIGVSGGIYQGSGTFAAPTTGLKIWNSGGYGSVAGYNTGNQMWAGAYDGLHLRAGSVAALRWDDAVDSDIYSVTVTPSASSPVTAIHSLRDAKNYGALISFAAANDQGATGEETRAKLNLVASDPSAPYAEAFLLSDETSTVVDGFVISHIYDDEFGSGAVANGFGTALRLDLGDSDASAVTREAAGRIRVAWVDKTHSTRKAKMTISAWDTAERDAIEIEASGTAAKIAFLGASAAARQSHITDPTGGGTADAEARTAINSILSVLETFGFTATS